MNTEQLIYITSTSIVVFSIMAGFVMWIISHKQKLRQEKLTSLRLEEQKKTLNYQIQKEKKQMRYSVVKDINEKLQMILVTNSKDVELLDIMLVTHSFKKMKHRLAKRDKKLDQDYIESMFILSNNIKNLKSKIAFKKKLFPSTNIKKLNTLINKLDLLIMLTEKTYLYVIYSLRQESEKRDKLDVLKLLDKFKKFSSISEFVLSVSKDFEEIIK